MADKFEKFTDQARKVFSLAQEEARHLNHNYIGTEHLLLGMVREGDGIAARVLANLGVSLPKVRSAVEFIIGRGDGLVVGDPGLTPRAKKVIGLAMDEARQLQSSTIGTEHLLLGIIREGGGIAAGVLESLGVSLVQVRRSVLQVVSRSATSQQESVHDVEEKDARADIGHAREMNARGIWRMLLALPDGEFERLSEVADQLGRNLDDLIREAIQRVWLTGESDTNTLPAE